MNQFLIHLFDDRAAVDSIEASIYRFDKLEAIWKSIALFSVVKRTMVMFWGEAIEHELELWDFDHVLAGAARSFDISV